MPLNRAFRGAYAVYAAALFVALSLPTLAVLLILPGLGRRRALAHRAARSFLHLAGLQLVVRHLEHLPESRCGLVSNHASYLDGLIYMAALPPRFGFVIKREMNAVPLAGVLLRRIGSGFVERFDRHRGGTDARRLLRAALSGDSLVFFPEGTFAPVPGLLKFHTGAFVIAARSGCVVVPATIRGSRAALPPGRATLRPGTLTIELLEPLPLSAQPPALASNELRERARAAILAALDEPDLTGTMAS